MIDVNAGFAAKVMEVFALLRRTNMRSNPRAPAHLRWLHDALTDCYSTMRPPKGFCIFRIEYRGGSLSPSNRLEGVPLDRIARTFVALEDYQQWLGRVQAGAHRHQQEIERQANSAIVRLETYSAMR